MRPKQKKSLIISICLSFGVVFGGLLSALPQVFAESPSETDVVEVSDFHHITIYDKGTKLSVKTNATTVAEVLDRADISLLPSDKVEPSLDSQINTDNYFINIYRSSPALVIDSGHEVFLMTSSLDPVTIAREAGFTVYDGDEVTYINNPRFLAIGPASVYEIIRGDDQFLTLTEEIPFTEETVYDYSLEHGKSEVVQLGEVGEKTVKYQILSIDGVEVSRTVISEEINRPSVPRITRVGANTGSSTSPSENEAIVWDFLISQGFSPVQTAGIMGNLAQEHGFSTTDTPGGLGIAQWTGGRRNNLLSRENPYDIYTQLNFLMDELDGSYISVKSAIFEATTIEDATIIFQDRFERCGICREDARISFAYDIYERYNR